MTTQRDILPEVLPFVQRHIPDCPVYVTGSVALRHERPDSDIDLFLVVPDVDSVVLPGGDVEWQDEDFKLIAATLRNTSLHFHLATPALLQTLEEHPWRAYKFLKMEMLHDPDRIVKQTMERIAPWFDEHPDAAQLWQQWLDEHKARQLSRGTQVGPLLKQHPNQIPDFWNHLDDTYGNEEIAEPVSRHVFSTAADGP